MVTDRIKEICLYALKKEFPYCKVEDFEIRKTFVLDDETNQWVDDSYSLFIQLSVDLTSCKNCEVWVEDVEFYLLSLFGFEVCIDFS
jgi:hypothetical protein